MMRMRFPRSRIKSSGQCTQCRLHPGNMVDTGRATFRRADGQDVEMLLWTCDKCGYTLLFDLAVPRSRPWSDEPGRVEEEPID